MNLPKKCGEMYIKFDKDGNPEYAFRVEKNVIMKFFNLTDKPIDTIVLPKLVNDFDVSSKEDTSNGWKIAMYFEGSVQIWDGCFSGLKKLKIIVPFNNSISFRKPFKEKSDIEFVLQKNLTFKRRYEKDDEGWEYYYKRFILICDRDCEELNEKNWYGSYDIENCGDYIKPNRNYDYEVDAPNFSIKHYQLQSDKTAINEDEREM